MVNTVDNQVHSLENQPDHITQAVANIQQLLSSSDPDQSISFHCSDNKHSCQPVDLYHIQITSQCHQTITPPVLFQVGVKVCWKCSGDLIRHVAIMEVTKPTLIHRLPIDHIKYKHGNEHDVPRADLFISEDAATKLDVNCLISANRSILTVSSWLDLVAIGGTASPDEMEMWEVLNRGHFNQSTFQTAIENLTLQDDSIVTLKRFHKSLSTSITAARKTGVLRLPNLTDLGPSITIRDPMLPPPTYWHFSMTKGCYYNIAHCIAM
jgi:hypothetical protein